MARRYRDVMRDLVDAIVRGDYPEGSWLPSVPELAVRCGAGRGVVREALHGLEERGLVAVQRARGPQVLQREDWDLRDPDVLAACIAHGPEPEVLTHAIRARAAIESVAAEWAVAEATAADLRLLRAQIDAMQAALLDGAGPRTPDADDPFVEADTWFHHILAVLGANDVLAKVVEPLHGVLAEARHAKAREREGAVVRHHQRILEGLSARDPDLAVAAIEGYADALVRWIGRKPRR
jgi:DNA-binding FadR family transcriptional regulator